MRRRDFMKAMGAGAAAMAIGGRRMFAADSADKKPNVLFIFSDDQTYESIRALGYDEVETPNLDRLVRGGTSFTHAYNQGAWHGAVCVASRCMLNTGRFLWNAKKVDSTKALKQEVAKGRFWSTMMSRAGYETYMTGKWHVKAEPADVFDTAVDPRPGMPNQTKEGYNRPHEGKPDPWKPWDEKFGGFWKGGKHWSEIVGDHGVSFLKKAAKSDKPFFMYLAFNAPHDPRQSPKSYVDKYPLDKIKVPVNFLPEYPHNAAMGCGRGLRDEKLAPFPRTKYAIKVNRQEYYAIITHMDAQVGRILDALEATGQADNTYIFFTGDHGLAVGHHGLVGKQNLFDHSVRVPLLVAGPGVPKNKRLDTPVYLQDIMPSSLEVAGIKKPAYVQFRSLMPLVHGRRKSSYDAVYGGYTNAQRMVTQDGYKLLLIPKIKKALLFNLADDPNEMNDLFANKTHRPTAKKLFARLLQLQKETGDTLDLKKVYPDL